MQETQENRLPPIRYEARNRSGSDHHQPQGQPSSLQAKSVQQFRITDLKLLESQLQRKKGEYLSASSSIKQIKPTRLLTSQEGVGGQ